MCDRATEFKDIYVHGECQKVFCFRSGMAVYEEILADGRYMASGRNNAGYTPNVLEAYPTRFAGYSQSVSGEKKLIDIFDSSSAFEIEADGISLDGSWEYVSFEKSEKNIENTQKSVLCAKLTVPYHFWTFAEHGGNPAEFKNIMTDKKLNFALLRMGEGIVV